MDGYFSGLHRELANLVELFPEVDRTVDRHRYHGLMEQLVQEFNHYVLLADILEYLLGRKIGADDTFQLPEEKALGELRRSLVSGSGRGKGRGAGDGRRRRETVPRGPQAQGKCPRTEDRRGHGCGLPG